MKNFFSQPVITRAMPAAWHARCCRKFVQFFILQASRDTSTQVNTTKANEDAQRLYSAGEKKWGTDEATFNMVMASRSFPQLRATFEAYHRIANRDIIRSIKGEFSGDIEDGLVSLVEVMQNAPGYFARRLYQSMKGAGTCDKDLIRAVVTRCEVSGEVLVMS